MWYNWLYHLSVLEFFPCIFLADKEQRLFCNVLLKVTFTDANTFCISCFSREWLFFYSHCWLNRFSVQESTVFDRSSVASLHFFIFYLAFAYPLHPVIAYWTQLTTSVRLLCTVTLLLTIEINLRVLSVCLVDIIHTSRAQKSHTRTPRHALTPRLSQFFLYLLYLLK